MRALLCIYTVANRNFAMQKYDKLYEWGGGAKIRVQRRRRLAATATAQLSPPHTQQTGIVCSRYTCAPFDHHIVCLCVCGHVALEYSVHRTHRAHKRHKLIISYLSGYIESCTAGTSQSVVMRLSSSSSSRAPPVTGGTCADNATRTRPHAMRTICVFRVGFWRERPSVGTRAGARPVRGSSLSTMTRRGGGVVSGDR